ncbi:MAG: leucine-rich repeat domain-containing protein [Clostridia bacterium]|nr:leucine-rich repeat domain-containing protein [Clostridia bacterium]
MIKRISVFIVIAITVFCCMLLSGCHEQPPADDAAGFRFALQGEEYAVTGYDGNTEITVPATYKGKPVTSITESAFHNSNVSRVIISDGIKTIGNNAFAAASGLYYIYISKSVTTIGDNIFSECSALTEIEVDEGNPSFSSLDGNLYDKQRKKLLAYSMGGAAKDFTLPEGVEEIKPYVFYSCYSLNNLILPSTLAVIGELALAGSSVSAFEVATGNTVFSSLNGILFSDSGTAIYSYPSSKTNESFEVDGAIKKIYADAFAYSPIKTLTLAEGIEEIGDRAFMHSALEEIVIPSTVSTIGESPFQNCTKLTEIIVSDYNSAYQDLDGNLYNKQGSLFIAYAAAKPSLSFSLPAGITEISEFAFFGAQYLEEAELPASLTKIGGNAFESFSLRTIVLNCAQPPDIEDTTFAYLDRLRIYVPDNKGQLFKDTWTVFEGIIREFHER